jgi:hypothetical protein
MARRRFQGTALASCRLGHGSPQSRWASMATFFRNTDDRAAQVIEAAFGSAIGERERE